MESLVYVVDKVWEFFSNEELLEAVHMYGCLLWDCIRIQSTVWSCMFTNIMLENLCLTHTLSTRVLGDSVVMCCAVVQDVRGRAGSDGRWAPQLPRLHQWTEDGVCGAPQCNEGSLSPRPSVSHPIIMSTVGVLLHGALARETLKVEGTWDHSLKLSSGGIYTFCFQGRG